MAGQSSLPPVVLLSERSDVRDAVRQALKSTSQREIIVAADAKDCSEKLLDHPAASLVLDWALGSVLVNRILGALRAHSKIEVRPILLVVPQIANDIIATAAEYGVSQLLSGPISVDSARAALAALQHEDQTTAAVRQALREIAVLTDKGDYTAALPLLRELNATHSGQDRIITELAENLIELEQWDEALPLLSGLAATEPPNIRALTLAGRCHLHQGDIDAAIALLGKAKLVNPHNVERLVQLGHAFLGVDKLAEARANFAAAEAVSGENKEVTEGLGQCMLMEGEVNEALTLLKSVSSPRELASLFNTAAVLSMRHSRFEHGMQLYHAAVTALGRNDKIAARLYYNMGLGYRRWAKLDKAKPCFERALALDPSFPKSAKQLEALAHLASAGGKAASVSGHGVSSGAVSSHFEEEGLVKGAVARAAPKPQLDVLGEVSHGDFDVED